VFDTLATLVSITFVLNLLLLVFNLIPVPPLDGSGVIGLFLSEQNASKLQALMHQPHFSLFGLLAAWFLIREIFGPAFGFALGLLYPELL
jgi:Zn-dependent protease